MLWAHTWSSAVCDGNWDKSMNQMKWWPKLAYSISTCTTSVALLIHLLHPPTSFHSLSLPDMLLLSLMSLLTPVNISEAARSCIICEMELQSDALSDTHWVENERVENDSHFGAAEPHFSNHYLPWFNDTETDKRDGLNTEERKE